MKLYELTLSPFAARVRLALRLKGVACEMEPPQGGSTRSPEHLALNPIGKIPVLVTDEGLAIAESETIIDYLEDTFPAPSLTPQGPALRAQMRNAIRTFELYAYPALTRLFGQLNPATRDAAVVAAEVAQCRAGLALTEKFVDDATFAVGGAPSKADCMLLPSLLLCDVIAGMLGIEDMLSGCPQLASYRAKARQHPEMGAVWDETSAALQARAGGG